MAARSGSQRFRNAVAISVTLALLAAGGSAFAGNQGSTFLSNEAAITGGAVVSHIEDAGAAWYNPAGLAAVDRSSLDLSASAFVLRRYSIPDAALTRVRGEPVTTSEATFTEVVSVPSALTYVRALSDDVTGALGVFVPDAEDLDVAAEFERAGVPSYVWNLTATRRTSRYLAGPAVGWRLSDRVRLGLSAFASYETSRAARVFQSTFHDPASSDVTDSALSVERTTRTRRFGGVLALGAQLEASPQWRLGLVVRSPHWVVGVLDHVREGNNASRVYATAPAEIDGAIKETSNESSTLQAYQPPSVAGPKFVPVLLTALDTQHRWGNWPKAKGGAEPPTRIFAACQKCRTEGGRRRPRPRVRASEATRNELWTRCTSFTVSVGCSLGPGWISGEGEE